MMNKNLFSTKTVFVLACGLSGLFAPLSCSQNTDTQTASLPASTTLKGTFESGVYTNDTHTFSICPPKEWSINESEKLGLIAFFLDLSTKSNINVTSIPAQELKLEDIVAAIKAELPESVQDYAVGEEERLNINGTPAILMSSSLTQNALTFKNAQLITIKNGVVYIVTGTACSTNWEKVKESIINSIKTFTVH